MNKRLFLSLLFILSLFIFNGCYYDNEEYLYGKNTCDTTNITFTGTINPILTQNCITCHGSGANTRLDSYAAVSVYAGNGKLEGTVTQASGYNPMPQGTSKLDDCSITKIKLWIKKGYPNN